MERLDEFAALLRKWNPSVRLTGSASDAAIGQHVAEALTLSPLLEQGARVVDVGSGGGFPAIPLALARVDLALTLVEPIGKKAAFLHECRRKLELDNVRIIRARDEDLLDRDDFELQDAAISQATFAPLEWLTRGQALVHDGGLVIAMLGAERDGLDAARFEIEIRETELDLAGAPPRALAIVRVERST